MIYWLFWDNGQIKTHPEVQIGRHLPKPLQRAQHHTALRESLGRRRHLHMDLAGKERAPDGGGHSVGRMVMDPDMCWKSRNIYQ